MLHLTPGAVDVIVLGAGAAGLMCAAEAGRRGRTVVVLERSAEPGKKILISGGGRCNFTNLYCQPENFLSENPHFAKSALARYGPSDFIQLVEEHGIAYHEKKLGQLFCDGSAKAIVDMLVDRCSRAGVRIVTGTQISEIRRTDRFHVETATGLWNSSNLVVATGGLSIPKIGATSFGYDLARKFGHAIQPCRPALVPLTFAPEDLERYGDLAGVALEVEASVPSASFTERMLITHRGLSGPAILQISSYWRRGSELTVDLLPGIPFSAQIEERRAAGDKSQVKTLLATYVPKRLADRWWEINADASETLPLIEDKLHAWKVRPAGDEGYAKAEVTAGGVDTSALSSKTMESRIVPGLYFIGEVVDVTGHLGGFNFQWAWASGFAAGQAV